MMAQEKLKKKDTTKEKWEARALKGAGEGRFAKQSIFPDLNAKGVCREGACLIRVWKKETAKGDRTRNPLPGV